MPMSKSVLASAGNSCVHLGRRACGARARTHTPTEVCRQVPLVFKMLNKQDSARKCKVG